MTTNVTGHTGLHVRISTSTQLEELMKNIRMITVSAAAVVLVLASSSAHADEVVPSPVPREPVVVELVHPEPNTECGELAIGLPEDPSIVWRESSSTDDSGRTTHRWEASSASADVVLAGATVWELESWPCPVDEEPADDEPEPVDDADVEPESEAVLHELVTVWNQVIA